MKIIKDLYKLVSTEEPIIDLINKNKQINFYKKQLKENSDFLKLIILEIILNINSILKIFYNTTFSVPFLYKTKNNNILNHIYEGIKVLNYCNLVKNLKLKFSKLSLYNKKLIFYTSLKIVELLFYGVVVGIVFASRNIYRILLVFPFLLENNFKVVD